MQFPPKHPWNTSALMDSLHSVQTTDLETGQYRDFAQLFRDFICAGLGSWINEGDSAGLMSRMNVPRHGDSQVLGWGSAEVSDAAFWNGFISHGAEIDDTHQAAAVHPGAVVFSASYALAVKLRSNGREFLLA